MQLCFLLTGSVNRVEMNVRGTVCALKWWEASKIPLGIGLRPGEQQKGSPTSPSISTTTAPSRGLLFKVKAELGGERVGGKCKDLMIYFLWSSEFQWDLIGEEMGSWIMRCLPQVKSCIKWWTAFFLKKIPPLFFFPFSSFLGFFLINGVRKWQKSCRGLVRFHPPV